VVEVTHFYGTPFSSAHSLMCQSLFIYDVIRIRICVAGQDAHGSASEGKSGYGSASKSKAGSGSASKSKQQVQNEAKEGPGRSQLIPYVGAQNGAVEGLQTSGR
jgi:hypothetical protein